MGQACRWSSADDILIVAVPDLANLRNTKNLYRPVEGRSRPNDRTPPQYCLNHGRRCRSGRKSAPAEFAKAIESDPIASIPLRRADRSARAAKQRPDDRRNRRRSPPHHRDRFCRSRSTADRPLPKTR
ncbi:MAG: hypothetical protein MZV49_21430 [Rhodopseudomonas palustris]|nr:hypothetical protein [Rhodopseudomonas palustris]